MPIIIAPSTALAALNTTTAATIVTQVQRDLQERFDTGPRNNLLVDYTNRIQQDILSRRKWDWMQSTAYRFITERGQTEYWIGPSGSEDDGIVDTGLNLSDVGQVKKGHVYNRSRWTEIFNVAESPNHDSWQRPDGSYVEGEPFQYRNDVLSPNLISLYPAPDTGSDYEIVPAAPHSTTSTSGALSARTYYIRLTFLDAAGNESLPSTTARQWIAANKVVTVKTPVPEHTVGSAGITYTQYNVYASTTEGSETKQGSAKTLGTDWTEDNTGLTSNGASVPTESTIDPLRGYLMEFRYYKQQAVVDSTGDTLLVPDKYIDVVTAGVNWLASQYLHRARRTGDALPEVQFWRDQYETGLRRMMRDQNPFPSGRAFIAPDPAACTGW